MHGWITRYFISKVILVGEMRNAGNESGDSFRVTIIGFLNNCNVRRESGTKWSMRSAEAAFEKKVETCNAIFGIHGA